MLTKLSPESVFFYVLDSGMPQALDVVLVDEAGNKFGMWSRDSESEIKSRYQGVSIIPVSEFVDMQNKACLTEPVQITEERFIEALEVMPPLHWVRRGADESFKFQERYSGNVTSIFVRLGKEFYTFNGMDNMTHDAIIAKVKTVAFAIPK